MIKKLTASAVQHIQGELRKLEARGLCVKQSGRVFVRCPFHHEKTPSCLVTTSVQSKYEIGSFKCLGCGEGGNWNKLAREMGLAEVDQFTNVSKTVVKYDRSYYDRNIIEDRHVSFRAVLEDLKLSNPTELPDEGTWRTLPFSFLKEVKACHAVGPNKTQFLFLPSYMNDEVVGGIRAVIKPSGEKSEVKYKNSSGEWSREKGLYPYDYVREKLESFNSRYGFRGLVLVEGARDSLCWNCEGMPTLGVLGTQSWCDGKKDRVLDLDPDFVLIATDGDPAGVQAEEKIWKDLKPVVPCRRLALSRFSKALQRKIDPGNAPPEVVQAAWAALHKRKSQAR